MISLWVVFAVIIGLDLWFDSMLYRHRGAAQPDDPSDKNPPVITGRDDARAQRLIDLINKKQSRTKGDEGNH